MDAMNTFKPTSGVKFKAQPKPLARPKNEYAREKENHRTGRRLAIRESSFCEASRAASKRASSAFVSSTEIVYKVDLPTEDNIDFVISCDIGHVNNQFSPNKVIVNENEETSWSCYPEEVKDNLLELITIFHEIFKDVELAQKYVNELQNTIDKCLNNLSMVENEAEKMEIYILSTQASSMPKTTRWTTHLRA